jgi:hypothetical protein
VSQERWVFIDKFGRLILHTENDGAAFMYRGAEVVEEEVTLKDLEQRYPRQHRQAVELLEDRSRHGKTRKAIHR